MSYVYDEAGQLIREVSGANTYEYTYDSKGNITSRKIYSSTGTTPDTDSFTYGAGTWKDRLTSYNNQAITYDSIGNPTSYLGATLSWRGRDLAGYTKGNKQISYSYDVDGMRYRKTVKTNGTETARFDYVYSDGTLILLTYTANGVANTARFVYDSYGEPRGFMLNDSATYLYLKNGQGDITGIVDENGTVLLAYAYTAWGEVTFSATDMQNLALAVTLSNVNPFTYRGYCYDYDIGMYYLQSRYYDPQICRFINADSTDYLGATGTLLSYNLFAYCENDGVNFVDVDGNTKKSEKPKNLESYIKKNYNKLITTFGNSKLKIQIKKNTITITANFSFSGSLKEKRLYHSKRRYETYRRTFLFGIESYWKGTYTVWGYKVKLETTASTKDNGIKVYMYSYTGISKVEYPSNGWKRNSFGTVSMYKGDSRNTTLYYSYDEFKWVSAHEFGHLLGVIDVPKGKANIVSIFNAFNTNVKNIDIEKFLRAFILNKRQGW